MIRHGTTIPHTASGYHVFVIAMSSFQRLTPVMHPPVSVSLSLFCTQGFLELGKGEAFDTFPNMFPNEQFLKEAEIKHGRQAMLAWTGVWATSTDGLGLHLHFPGAPVEPDWTKALGVFATENPGVFGTVLLMIAIAEGESVGHSGDNFRGKSTKTVPGDLNFDYLGIKKKVSAEKMARYTDVEIKVSVARRGEAWRGVCAMVACRLLASMAAWHDGECGVVDLQHHDSLKKLFHATLQNGRAAMIAMASLFSWKAIPGSVPLMDLLAP